MRVCGREEGTRPQGRGVRSSLQARREARDRNEKKVRGPRAREREDSASPSPIWGARPRPKNPTPLPFPPTNSVCRQVGRPRGGRLECLSPPGAPGAPRTTQAKKKKRDPPTCFFSYNGATGSKDYPACLSDGRARALAMCLPSRPLRAASLTLPSTSLTGAASPPLAGAAAAAPLPVCRPDTLAGEAFTMVAIVVVWGEGRVDASRGEQAVVGRCPGAGRRARQARERSVRVLRRAATSNQFVSVFGVSRGRGGGVRTGEDGEQMTALSRCSLSFLRARAAPPPPRWTPRTPTQTRPTRYVQSMHTLLQPPTQAGSLPER